ncbi:hypothetical protein PMIN04_005487 [Paraphaeosphaeria minitans]
MVNGKRRTVNGKGKGKGRSRQDCSGMSDSKEGHDPTRVAYHALPTCHFSSAYTSHHQHNTATARQHSHHMTPTKRPRACRRPSGLPPQRVLDSLEATIAPGAAVQQRTPRFVSLSLSLLLPRLAVPAVARE